MVLSTRIPRARWYLALPLVLAACGGGGGGGQGGAGGEGGTGGGSGGGQGGGGGAPTALVDDGLIRDDCAPDDGAAISADIGTASACGMPLDNAAAARFYAFPADLSTLAAGDEWSYLEGMPGDLSVSFFPDGGAGMSESVKSGHLQVVSVTATEVELAYSFETTAGVSYAGTAKVSVCDGPALCG
jgi:hypothetical protein